MAEKSNTETEQQQETLQGEDDKLADSLVSEDAPAAEMPTEEPPAETAEETPAEQEATEQPAAEAPSEEPPAEQPATDPPTQPGTPNKVLQAAQQNQGAIERKLDALMAKIEEQGRATPQQAEQVQQLKVKAEEVADEISELAKASPDTVDGFEGTIKVAKGLVKHREVVGEEIKSLRAEMSTVKAELQSAREEANRATLQTKFGPGWEKVWAEAQSEAQELGATTDLHAVANRLFHRKIAAATTKPEVPANKPAPATTSSKAPVKPATANARSAPPVTAGGASVTAKSGAIKRPVSESDEDRLDRLSDELYRR